jgi:hypothetical protein
MKLNKRATCSKFRSVLSVEEATDPDRPLGKFRLHVVNEATGTSVAKDLFNPPPLRLRSMAVCYEETRPIRSINRAIELFSQSGPRERTERKGFGNPRDL